MTQHEPVLLHEVISILHPENGEFFIDGTLGGGGHANEIISRLGTSGIFLGCDWDNDAVSKFHATQCEAMPKIILRQSNYTYIPDILQSEQLPKANGLLVDLGFSSDQIENGEKGFSFQHDGPLDMRYGNEETTAAEIVNSWPEQDIAHILKEFGEERFALQIAKRIVEARKKEKILSTHALETIVFHAIPSFARKGKVHPATRTFQALRIVVNHEFENIRTLIHAIPSCLASGGRVGIISFHSLEDRIVKQEFKSLVDSGIAVSRTKKPIIPTQEEMEKNPRSRSAKLRVIEIK